MARILLDLTPLEATSTRRGIGRYVRGLLRGIAELPATQLHGLELCGFSADPRFQGLQLVEDVQAYAREPARTPVAYADARRNLLISLDLPALGRSLGGTPHLTDPKGIPWSRMPGVTLTAHDLIPLLLPELYLPKLPGWPVLYRELERFRYGRARGLLAVSAATRVDLCERLGVAPDLVEVVHHGVEHERFHPRAEAGEGARLSAWLGHAEPFVLYLGAGDARKDLGTLLAAFARGRLARHARLLIAGHLGPGRTAALQREASRLGVSDRVALPGFVPESLVPALYRACALHVFPSRYEGFGLPVLEAMACGAPTLTSPGSSLEEVAGGAAAIVPCGNIEAMSAQLEALFFDEPARSGLRQRGLDWAAHFTWRKCAAQTLDFLRRYA